MSGDATKKVTGGEPFKPSARAWNSFIDAAEDFKRRTAGFRQGEAPPPLPAGWVYVRNDSGADRERFEVLGLDEPLIERDDEQAFLEFAATPAFVGSTPNWDRHKGGRFCVLQEPIGDGKIGRAVATGITPVCVPDLTSRGINPEFYRYADIADGDCSGLTQLANIPGKWSGYASSGDWSHHIAGFPGSALILHQHADYHLDDGRKIVIVRLGNMSPWHEPARPGSSISSLVSDRTDILRSATRRILTSPKSGTCRPAAKWSGVKRDWWFRSSPASPVSLSPRRGILRLSTATESYISTSLADCKPSAIRSRGRRRHSPATSPPDPLPPTPRTGAPPPAGAPACPKK